jgi:hypothetical protein
MPFYGYNRPDSDLTEGLEKIDVPTLILHVDD